MAESFSISSLVIPGTYVQVRADALISAGGISTGNIGIVGTAAQGFDKTAILSEYGPAVELFGPSDAASASTLNLTRGLEILFRNGARTVYARALATGAGVDEYDKAFGELIKDEVNILVAPELSTSNALNVLGSIAETAENAGRDVLVVVGADATTPAAIAQQAPTNDRIIFTAPGIETYDAVTRANVVLRGTYSAAAVAGLLSTLTPETSPTNKTLPGVTRLALRFSYGELKQLVSSRVMVLEARQGVRVVRGLTSDNGAFQQVTTRRITDFAKAGIRKASDPFIGKLNNARVRKALHGAIAGFLTTMVVDEQLVTFDLEVSATRQDEIAGRAMVKAVLQPTFSIDFIAVTVVLQ